LAGCTPAPCWAAPISMRVRVAFIIVTTLTSLMFAGTVFIYPLLHDLGLLPFTPQEYVPVVTQFLEGHGPAAPGLGLSPSETAAALQLYPCTQGDCGVPLSAILADAAIVCTTRLILEAHAKINPATFEYLFTHAPSYAPAPYLGAFHSSEIPYVFDTIQGYPATPAEIQLGTDMANAWATFATIGNPTTPAQPAWPPVLPNLSVMHIEIGNWTVGAPPSTAFCPFWDGKSTNRKGSRNSKRHHSFM
jgi:hypothetical protein